MVLWLPTRNINFSVPEELLIEIDEAAKRKYMSRTEYIRFILHNEVGGQYPEAIHQALKDNPARLLDLDDS
jgi:metal-responsive CopG/Arc/MetJ family transcriptional regulator